MILLLALGCGGTAAETLEPPVPPDVVVSEEALMDRLGDDAGAWREFLTTNTVEDIAKQLERAHSGQMMQVLEKERGPSNDRISAEDWAQVHAPRLTVTEGGAHVFEMWFGQPPGFYPMLYRVTVTEEVSIERLPPVRAEAAVDPYAGLHAENRQARKAAARGLAGAGPEAVPALSAALDAESDQAAAFAMVDTLAAIGGDEAIVVLRRVSEGHDNGRVRNRAASALP